MGQIQNAITAGIGEVVGASIGRESKISNLQSNYTSSLEKQIELSKEAGKQDAKVKELKNKVDFSKIVQPKEGTTLTPLQEGMVDTLNMINNPAYAEYRMGEIALKNTEGKLANQRLITERFQKKLDKLHAKYDNGGSLLTDTLLNMISEKENK